MRRELEIVGGRLDGQRFPWADDRPFPPTYTVPIAVDFGYAKLVFVRTGREVRDYRGDVHRVYYVEEERNREPAESAS